MAVPLVLKGYRVCLCGTSLWSPLFSLCMVNVSKQHFSYCLDMIPFLCVFPAPPSEGSVDGSVITIPSEDNMEQGYTQLLFI